MTGNARLRPGGLVPTDAQRHDPSRRVLPVGLLVVCVRSLERVGVSHKPGRHGIAEVLAC